MRQSAAALQFLRQTSKTPDKMQLWPSGQGLAVQSVVQIPPGNPSVTQVLVLQSLLAEQASPTWPLELEQPTKNKTNRLLTSAV
jgi:hypothetical protein